jgi:hypothetical protein
MPTMVNRQRGASINFLRAQYELNPRGIYVGRQRHRGTSGRNTLYITGGITPRVRLVISGISNIGNEDVAS